jgi:hypothetical protein
LRHVDEETQLEFASLPRDSSAFWECVVCVDALKKDKKKQEANSKLWPAIRSFIPNALLADMADDLDVEALLEASLKSTQKVGFLFCSPAIY